MEAYLSRIRVACWTNGVHAGHMGYMEVYDDTQTLARVKTQWLRGFRLDGSIQRMHKPLYKGG